MKDESAASGGPVAGVHVGALIGAGSKVLFSIGAGDVVEAMMDVSIEAGAGEGGEENRDEEGGEVEAVGTKAWTLVANDVGEVVATGVGFKAEPVERFGAAEFACAGVGELVVVTVGEVPGGSVEGEVGEFIGDIVVASAGGGVGDFVVSDVGAVDGNDAGGAEGAEDRELGGTVVGPVDEVGADNFC